LLDVGGRPFLNLLIDRAVALGIADILLLCGYLADAIVVRYHGKKLGGSVITCVTEKQAAGTAGALALAAPYLDETFFLLNGDSLLDMDLMALAVESGPDGQLPNDQWIGRLALRHVEDAGRFGAVEVQGERIVRFTERGVAAPGLINGGVYLLRRQILEWIGTAPCSLERDVFPELAARGHIGGRRFDGFFIDIGVPEDLERARRLLPTRFADNGHYCHAGRHD